MINCKNEIFCLLLPFKFCYFYAFSWAKIPFFEKKNNQTEQNQACDCPMKVIPLNTMKNFKNLKILYNKMVGRGLGDVNSNFLQSS